jgi:hypothetical protein
MRTLVRFLHDMRIHVLVFPSMYQYTPSTYWYILVKVLKLQVQYIPPCNACHYSGEIDILIWYLVHLDLHSLQGCAMYLVPKQNVDFS